MNVLFICTGNTCRSPMAEALLKHKLPKLNVKSAGIYAYEKESANHNAIRTLKEKNINLVHSAQQVTMEILAWADIVLTMTNAHKQILLENYPKYAKKVYTLIEYTTSVDSNVSELSMKKDIADPFGGNLDVYRKTLSELELYINYLMNKIDR